VLWMRSSDEWDEIVFEPRDHSDVGSSPPLESDVESQSSASREASASSGAAGEGRQRSPQQATTTGPSPTHLAPALPSSHPRELGVGLLPRNTIQLGTWVYFSVLAVGQRGGQPPTARPTRLECGSLTLWGCLWLAGWLLDARCWGVRVSEHRPLHPFRATATQPS